MIKFWMDYPQIDKELDCVKSSIIESITSNEKLLNTRLENLVKDGGKMLRPAFVLLASKFGQSEEQQKFYDLAAVIEMLHMATLIHDDIIDDAELRRGKATIQSSFGKDYAVYVGDFLLCQCFIKLSHYSYEADNLKEISKAMSRICLGEIKQYHLRGEKNVGALDYIKVIAGKTAALFGISFYVGAREADCDEKLTKLLGRIGFYIGMAFQVMDDLLDYSSDTVTLGKDAQSDLLSGYYTLPLIYALKKDRHGRLGAILAKEDLDQKDIDEILTLVNEYGGIEKAKHVADKYTKKALTNIDKLPDCESKAIIRDITVKLLKRNY
ncbi:polyprenyl synthetase family protein [Vallitalea okinawensis]|uniref:polyprenyl synthetase family protein n=1 Tax=Vallitalea okinawensis TaxID=2078660 RepID=UPI000CFBC740|nr:polyprenyl synthetase family protein [Vallitalea okinawensis]